MIITFFVHLYRYDDQFVMVNFDGDPTADSEQYNKLESPVRDDCESRVSSVCSSFPLSVGLPVSPFQHGFIYSLAATYFWTCLLIFHLDNTLEYNFDISPISCQAVMKSFSVNGTDPTKQEKFLAYMAPAPHEVPVHLLYLSIHMVDRESINLMGTIVVLQLARDLDDDDDDVQYSWLREYHWEVCVLSLTFAILSVIWWQNTHLFFIYVIVP